MAQCHFLQGLVGTHSTQSAIAVLWCCSTITPANSLVLPAFVACLARSPDSTNCSDPQAGAALLPNDGFWHTNVFSEQVHECPNPTSCTGAGRADRLKKLQAIAVSLLAEVQRNASIEKVTLVGPRFAATSEYSSCVCTEHGVAPSP